MQSLGPTQTSRTRACTFESPGREQARPSDSGQRPGTFLVVTTGGGYSWHQVAEARGAAQHPPGAQDAPTAGSSVEEEEPWIPRQVTGLTVSPDSGLGRAPSRPPRDPREATQKGQRSMSHLQFILPESISHL